MKRLLMVAAAAALSLAAPRAAHADAKQDYTKNCASCHGPDGKGKTKMGDKLHIKDLTDPKVQAAFTDEQAAKSIGEGINDEKTGKVLMPAKKDKLSPEQIKEVVGFVRAFKQG
jgi:mono/diheme cytochrome c family protein